MANRITSALHAKNGGNQSELARFIGVSPQAVQKWVAGDSEPRGENLRKAAEFLGVSEAFLKFGVTDVNSIVVPHQAIKGARPVRAVGDDEEIPGIVRIPKVRLKISAGISGYAIDEIYGEDPGVLLREVWLAKRGIRREDCISIEVQGQSMEPSLYEGDTVVVNTADRKPSDGDVYAINYEGEAVVKRMVREIGFWWLVSDNQDQRRYPRKRCEGDMCIVIGKVIYKQSERI